MRTTDTILVGFDRDPNDVDTCILIVGRKRVNRDTTDIIKAFYGKEAEELYKKLTEKGEEK